eukprot:Gb_20984 [translate_table: standard]
MRIITARSPSASPSPPSSPLPSSSKRRPPPPKRWRRVDCVLTFPSSKRVQRAPDANQPTGHSIHRSSQHHSFGTTTRARQCPSSHSHQRRTQDHDATCQSPIIKVKPSVWARLSEKPINDQIIGFEDFEVFASAKKKSIPADSSDDISEVSAEDRNDCNVSEMDIDQKGTVDGSKRIMENNEEYDVLDVSHKFTIGASPSSTREKPLETDPHKLSQRQKQIDYGKNTLGYERYIEIVPRLWRPVSVEVFIVYFLNTYEDRICCRFWNQRKRYHPQTPDIKQVCSKRSWDGQVKKWRRLLHEFDPPVNENDESPELFSVGGGNAATTYVNNTDDNTENQENRITAIGLESNPTREGEVSGIYDDWDTMEP